VRGPDKDLDSIPEAKSFYHVTKKLTLAILGPADEDFIKRSASIEVEDTQDVDEIQQPQADTCASQY